MLAAENLSASYGPLQALREASFRLGEGEVVALLGANGAGKTTTLRAITGSIVQVTGSLEYTSEAGALSLIGTAPADAARHGIAHVPQGRGTFTDLSVEDNLRVGAMTRRDRGEIEADLDHWFATFPRLKERRRKPAGNLSGGEQQMLAVARAMMMRPRLLLLDEPSLGLAPLVVADLFATLGRLRAELGVTVLLVEQNANIALELADRGYVLEAGRIVLEGTAADLMAKDEIQKAYLGQ
uniref:ABC transporter ATP-binding protein n=1 Tax=Actinomadura physcomitrii TaxID=2650748 RepID=UPI0038B3F84A